MTKKVTARELKSLKKQGFNVVETKKRPATPEDKILAVAQTVLDTAGTVIDINTKAAFGLIEESKKQTDALIAVVEKETPKKKFKCSNIHRDKKGQIKDFTLEEM